MSADARASAARRPRTSAGEAVGQAVSRLRVVPEATARASSGAFALFVAAVLALGLLGLLALNTLLTQGSFASTDLGRRHAALADQEQALRKQVAELGSPTSLALAARRLGMVATTNPAFIDPRTGRVLGVPSAGRAVPRPTASAVAGPTTGPTTGPSAGAASPAAVVPAAPKPSAAAKPSAGARPSTGPTTGTR